MGKGDNRTSGRVSFCEWNSASFGYYNTGSLLCLICKHMRSIPVKGSNILYRNYKKDNSVERDHKCPNCGKNNWVWVPPISRVPRKNASFTKWRRFLKQLKERDFNHPKDGCR